MNNNIGGSVGLSFRQVTPARPAPVDLNVLKAASRVLFEQFSKDAQAVPDLAETLSTQSSALYSIFPDDYRVPFQKRKLIGIPDGLFQYYNTTNLSSHMGLVPEIERVWITIDHKLFLWDYVEGQAISSFVDQPDVITLVAIVKPKPGVFIEEITSLFVICTPVSVLLLGISSASSPGPDNRIHKDIKLYATDMTLALDVEMDSVIGTRDGRIFMGGASDGNLYELHYQQTESWFAKRVQLINHSVGSVQSLLPRFASSTQEDRIICLVSDLQRDCFYVLTSSNTISVYTTNGEKRISHIQTISNLYKLAQDKAPGSPALTPQNFQLISLHIIEQSESRSGVQLMAITTNGVRLYFSPLHSYGYSHTPSTTGLQSLQLMHVRLPPTELLHPDEQSSRHRAPIAAYGGGHVNPQPTTRPYILSTLDSACYAEGLMVAAQVGDTDGTDFVLCLSPDLTRIGTLGQTPSVVDQTQYHTSPNLRPQLAEHAALLAIPGRTWGMAVVSKTGPTSTLSGTPSHTVTNELATQFTDSPRQFMILTNVGLTFLVKRRALDYLRAVIEQAQADGNIRPILEFRESFGRDQTCAMLLGLASGNTFLDVKDGSPTGTMATLSPEMANVAKQAFYDFGHRPEWRERQTFTNGENFGATLFSGRREGLALYLARLVRPLWRSKLTSISAPGLHQCLIPDLTLVTVQKNLYALKDFLDTNPHMFHSSAGDLSNASATEQEAWQAEHASVIELMTLLARTIEAISFVLLLTDYRLGELIVLCDSKMQTLITGLTFEDLVTTLDGINASRALVNVVIDQQIGQQISVDTISDVLQQRCGSFCSTDDVMLYKAKENIRKAVETRNATERQNCLAESLRLFVKSARILEFDKLREVCGDYQQLAYAKGAVELPLACAQSLDPNNAGLECWYLGSPNNDPRVAIYEGRVRCYDLVLDSLMVFEETGLPDATDTVRGHAYELAFASEDDMFHSTLYDWLISRGRADELLEMRPTFLEAHLKREPATVEKYQLLWQFYVKDGQPLRAAEVLAALAESTQFHLPLDTRLEYLTLAVGNAKSHPISVGGRHETAIAFLTDLEEKLDVAQVQLEIYNELSSHMADAPEVATHIQLLSKRLFTMSELYQDYAVAFDLDEMKLLCLHVSEHRDQVIVRPIWNKIFQEILDLDRGPKETADLLISRLIPLGQRFYPSESAFPLRHIATLLVRFTLVNKNELPFGWAPRILVQCRVPFSEIWDVFHEMYESQVPPFNEQSNVQAISSDIAVLLSDWLEEAKRPSSSSSGRAQFPVGRIDIAVDTYLAEVDPARRETRTTFEKIKHQLRRNW